MASSKPLMHGTIELKHILPNKDLRSVAVNTLCLSKREMEVKF